LIKLNNLENKFRNKILSIMTQCGDASQEAIQGRRTVRYII